MGTGDSRSLGWPKENRSKRARLMTNACSNFELRMRFETDLVTDLASSSLPHAAAIKRSFWFDALIASTKVPLWQAPDIALTCTPGANCARAWVNSHGVHRLVPNRIPFFLCPWLSRMILTTSPALA